MPIPAAAIQGGSNVLASLFNIGSQALTNKANRRFTEKMMAWENQTNINNWNMQNEYNDPKNQMARLKAAGLNPQLVWAGGGVSNTASSAQGASASGGQAKAPEIDPSFFTSIFMNFIDLEKKRAEVDLLKSQTESQAISRQAAIQGIQAGAWELEHKKKLEPGQLTAMELQNKKIQADTAYTEAQNARADIMQEATLKKMAEEVQNLRSQRRLNSATVNEISQRIRNMVLDGKLKALELKYGTKGIIDAVLGQGSFVQEIPGLIPKVNKAGAALDSAGRAFKKRR